MLTAKAHQDRDGQNRPRKDNHFLQHHAAQQHYLIDVHSVS